MSESTAGAGDEAGWLFPGPRGRDGGTDREAFLWALRACVEGYTGSAFLHIDTTAAHFMFKGDDEPGGVMFGPFTEGQFPVPHPLMIELDNTSRTPMIGSASVPS